MLTRNVCGVRNWKKRRNNNMKGHSEDCPCHMCELEREDEERTKEKGE